MNGCIVMSSGCKAFDGKSHACLCGDASIVKFIENGVVIRRITNERDTFMVLRRSADEGHTTDVNVFDGICKCDIWFRNRFFKWIEIHCNEVNIIPTEIKQLLMIFLCGAGEQASMNGWMERLDASAEDFRRLSIVRDLSDSDVVLT